MSGAAQIIQDAETHCAETGARFTAPRSAVLTIIATTTHPIGAYDIIKAMPGDTKPPTVYRALEFWEQEGFIHRIGSLNLYTLCRAGHRHQGAQFLICKSCGTVTEAHICSTPGLCADTAKSHGFKMDGWFLELHGLCAACQPTGHAVSGHGCC